MDSSAAFQGRIETFRAEHEDFEKLVFDPNLKISETMVGVLMDSDRGPEVLYYLGKHPEEADRISGMSAFAAARELGRIEERLNKGESQPAPVKKVPKAPAPIRPVEGSGSVDKSLAEMNNEEYRRARQKKRA
jgi:hypothetical protein